MSIVFGAIDILLRASLCWLFGNDRAFGHLKQFWRRCETLYLALKRALRLTFGSAFALGLFKAEMCDSICMLALYALCQVFVPVWR